MLADAPSVQRPGGLALTDVSVAGNGGMRLSGASITLGPGRFLALLGGAHAGKSSLLDLLAGHATSRTGTMLWDGAELRRRPAHRRGFGFVAQNDALFPSLTLAQNIAYPLVLRRAPRQARARLVEAAMETVLLANGHILPHQATRAERQRAWIARATVFGPAMLLLDEPLSRQPPESHGRMLDALRRLHAVLGTTTIMATRVASHAMALADSLAILDHGRIVQTGTPALVYQRPASSLAARATGAANLLPGIVRAIDEDGIARASLLCGPSVEGEAAPGLRVRDTCLLCLRPERVALAPTSAAEMGGAALDATVLEALQAGDALTIRLVVGTGQEIIVARPAAAGLRGIARGQGVAIAWQPQHAVVFRDDR